MAAGLTGFDTLRCKTIKNKKNPQATVLQQYRAVTRFARTCMSEMRGETTTVTPPVTRAGSWYSRDLPAPVGASTNTASRGTRWKEKIARGANEVRGDEATQMMPLRVGPW